MMRWLSFLLGVLAFLTAQAWSYPELELPSLSYEYTSQNQPSSDEEPAEYEQPYGHEDAKRALTLLSRLGPIRKVFRQQQGNERHFDSRSFRPRWHTNINERAPGPLRWGRR